MRWYGQIFICGLMVGLVVCAPAFAADSLAGAINQFTLDLYKQVAAGSGESNIALSPFSVHTALLMTYAGARGKTAEEMAEVMHLSGAPDSAGLQFRELREVMAEQARQDAVNHWTMANALWIEQRFNIRDEFQREVQRDFDATAERLSFIGAADQERARERINGWVSSKTNGRIKTLIEPPQPNGMTRLILTNALWFKGQWAHKFDKSSTRPQAFHTTEQSSTQVPMMHLSSDEETHRQWKPGMAPIRRLEMADFQLAELPYMGGKYAMLVLLPRKTDGLPALMAQCDDEHLRTWLSQLSVPQSGYEISFPKLTMKSRSSLVPPLQALGMRMVFSDDADLGGIAAESLSVADVVHAVWVSIDEEGTEAAAATGIMVEALSARPPDARFIFVADHPYLFLIRDNTTGAILFIGRVADPSKG